MWVALIVIALVLGVIVSNIMLLKHTANMSMKNVNQDPIEKARKLHEERKNKNIDD